MKCKQCGFCCQNFSLPPMDEMKNQLAARQMMAVMGFPLIDYIPEPVHLSIGIVIRDSPCRNYNQLSHLCMDYLGRPDFCRNFYCAKCVEEADGKTEAVSGDSEATL